MSPRIGIVGAGPGGLSLARLLTERGYADVTVLERADRVGGKSLTVHHQGLAHELGTCYVTLGYVVVKRWMEEAGIGAFDIENHVIRKSDGEVVPFKDFVEGPMGLLGATPQAARYSAAWLRFHEWDLRGCPDDAEGTKGGLMRDEVAMPFGAWIDARGLDVIGRMALRSMSILGYGSLDRVPTLYGLRWNMPSLLATGALWGLAEPVAGFSSLWQSIADKLDVRTGRQIERVERSGAGFVVHTGAEDFAFDHLVITSPLDEAAAWFPFSAEERRGFSVDAVGWHEYVSTLVEATGWFRDVDTFCIEDRAKDAAAVARGQLMVARRTGDKTPVARARSATRPDVYVCYRYGDPTRSDDEQIATLRDDLAAEGATMTNVLRHCRWKYAPQLAPAAIRDGAASRMERQQGRGNLWITGATASHESVDNIVNYNARLTERMAIAFEGGDPSSDHTFAHLAAKFSLSLDDL